MWCMRLSWMENKWGCEECGRGFHCLPLIGQAWRHSPPRLPPPSLPPPSCSPLKSSPLPPSVFASLPLLLSSRHPHHNRSISYNVSNLDLGDKSLGFLFICCFFLHFFPSSSLPPIDACWSFFSPTVLRSQSYLPPIPLPPPSPLLC